MQHGGVDRDEQLVAVEPTGAVGYETERPGCGRRPEERELGFGGNAIGHTATETATADNGAVYRFNDDVVDPGRAAGARVQQVGGASPGIGFRREIFRFDSMAHAEMMPRESVG